MSERETGEWPIIRGPTGEWIIPSWDMIDSWPDLDDDPSSHSDTCTCETCIQNYPERIDLYLDDDQADSDDIEEQLEKEQ